MENEREYETQYNAGANFYACLQVNAKHEMWYQKMYVCMKSSQGGTQFRSIVVFIFWILGKVVLVVKHDIYLVPFMLWYK